MFIVAFIPSSLLQRRQLRWATGARSLHFRGMPPSFVLRSGPRSIPSSKSHGAQRARQSGGQRPGQFKPHSTTPAVRSLSDHQSASLSPSEAARTSRRTRVNEAGSSKRHVTARTAPAAPTTHHPHSHSSFGSLSTPSKSPAPAHSPLLYILVPRQSPIFLHAPSSLPFPSFITRCCRLSTSSCRARPTRALGMRS